MHQISLWNDTERIVNVASVPLRSPFRYPGGKTWLIPYIRQWLMTLDEKPKTLVEPFVGGGIVSLTAVAEGLVETAIMVERDEQIAAVWNTIINDDGGGEWLADRIVEFRMTPEAVQLILSQEELTKRELAFRTILKNRVNRGGIIAPGAGLVKHGEGGKGLMSRWYPVTLKKRIIEIVRMRDRIKFIHGDGLHILRENIGREDTVYFIDPPYTVAGKRAGSRLYTYPNVDHEELFKIAERLEGDLLITYDNTEEVKQYAQKHRFNFSAVAMKNTHHAKMDELLIGRGMQWLGEPS